MDSVPANFRTLVLLSIGVIFPGWIPLCRSAETPLLLPFQGRLVNASNVPFPDGHYLLKFELFNTPASVDGSALSWSGELHTATINQGLVNVVLGTRSPLGVVDFNQLQYLQLTVDANKDGKLDKDDPPLLPRQVLLPSVFARESANSRNLNGLNWSAVFGTNNPAQSKIPADRLSEEALVPRGGLIALPIHTPAPVGYAPSDLSVVTTASTVEKANLLTNLLSFAYAALGNKIYVAAGTTLTGPAPTAQSFDPSENAWRNIPGPAQRRVDPVGVAADGRFFVIGGANTNFTPVGFVEAFNPQTLTWTNLAPLPLPVIAPAAAALPGRILVFGGFSGVSGQVNSILIQDYDIQKNSWTTNRALVPVPCNRLGAVELGGLCYVFGGAGSFGALDFSSVYDPGMNRWRAVERMPLARQGIGLCVLNNKIHIMGGQGALGTFPRTVNIYDPSTDTWEDGGTLEAAARTAGVAQVNSQIYVFGALNRLGEPDKTYLYRPPTKLTLFQKQ